MIASDVFSHLCSFDSMTNGDAAITMDAESATGLLPESNYLQHRGQRDSDRPKRKRFNHNDIEAGELDIWDAPDHNPEGNLMSAAINEARSNVDVSLRRREFLQADCALHTQAQLKAQGVPTLPSTFAASRRAPVPTPVRRRVSPPLIIEETDHTADADTVGDIGSDAVDDVQQEAASMQPKRRRLRGKQPRPASWPVHIIIR